jgi:uncharacterized RDD family membrane protein YckC
MSRRWAGVAVTVVGVAAALISALANTLGIGHPGFGPKKVVLLVIGILLVIIGLAMVVSSRDREPPEDLHHMRG